MARNDPMEQLRDAGQDFMKALGDKALSSVGDKVTGLTERLEDIAGGGPIGKAVAKGGEAKAKGDSPVAGALKGAVSGVKDKITGGGGGGRGGGDATKSTNIIESIDVGVPVSVAYNQWTQFADFPSFMKKVESVEAEEDEELKFKAQIFWSHRVWKAHILEQVPDERIVWRSEGEKGHVDGAVTFHELGPNLTRILLVLEYYPQGLFEKTGNIWRAQGRRVRAELRHFRRHVMTRTILEPDEVEGWRGVIEEGEVEESHEEVIEEEEQQAEDADGDESQEDAEEPEGEYQDEDEVDEEPEGEYDEGEAAEEEPEDEDEDEDEPEDEPEDEDEDEPEAEYDEEEPADEEPEDEYDEEEPAEEEPEDEDEAEDEDEEYEEEPEEEAPDDYEDEADEQPRRRRRRAS